MYVGTSITGACPTLARSEATVPVRTFCWKIIDHKTLSLPALEALIMPRRNEGVLSARVCNRNFDVYCEQSGKYDCGHASLKTTQRYLHVEIGDLKKMHSLYHPRERMNRDDP